MIYFMFEELVDRAHLCINFEGDYFELNTVGGKIIRDSGVFLDFLA